MSEGFVDVLGTGKSLRTEEQTVGGKLVEVEAIYHADPTDILAKANVRKIDPATSDYGIVVRQAPSPKTLADASGVLTGAGTVTLTGQCVGGRIFANGADGSFTINSGSVHNVRSGTGFDLNLTYAGLTVLVNPVITWVSGSLDISLFCLQ